MALSMQRFPALTLNTDGHRHPRENTLVLVAAALGVLSFTTSFFYHLHLLSSWAGLFGVVAGLWGQFVSVTTAERFVLVISTGLAAFGFYLGIAHGGLW